MKKLPGGTRKFKIDAALQDMLGQIEAYQETKQPYQGDLDLKKLAPVHRMIVNSALTSNDVAEEHFFAPPEAIDQPKAKPVSDNSGVPATPGGQKRVKFEVDPSPAAGACQKNQEANDRKIAETLAEEDDAPLAQAPEINDAEETTAQADSL